MSELQQYYDDFRSGYWADEDPNRCRCHGSGWALSEVDTWHECPIHYKGQIHPEYYRDAEAAGCYMDPYGPNDFHDVCPECNDGLFMPYSECKTCNASVQMEDDENHPPHSEADTYRYEEGDLPF